jgi:hypothetical protein
LAESPLATLARIAGGIVLMQGNLGHQVLGQLLVMNSNEVAMMGAAAILAGASGDRHLVGQMALRTVVPALAVRTLLNKQERRVELKLRKLREGERALDKRRARRRKRRQIGTRSSGGRVR